MRTSLISWALVAIATAAALTACGARSPRGHGVRVVATTTQLGDFARAVGGERIALVTILRPNTDPHEYEPRPSDVEAVARARLILESGDGLDGWMAKLVGDSGSRARVVDVGAAVPDRRPHDPHWWHDPRNAAVAVRTIRDALGRAEPAQRAAFAMAAARYERRVARLDAGIAACMRAVPAARRRLVTDHDAFGYFARRYGILIVGAVIPSQTTAGQPSAQSVAQLVRVIRREHVRAVFPEHSVNAALANAIASQSGASARYTLYGDTLGPAGSPGASYLRMEQANADAIVRGFTGGARGCRIRGL